MKARWFFRAVVVLAFCVLRSPVGAEELGFPKGCVELQKVPPEVVAFYALSSRDSVLFRLDLTSGKDANGNSRSFVAWDTETGQWLGRRPAPNALALMWQFSPDGKLLAVPVQGDAKLVQLWEVGSKDIKGVPQLRLIAELRPREMRPRGQPNAASPPGDSGVEAAWTPDSKTLIVNYHTKSNFWNAQILFWSFTDKPSVWSDPPHGDREPTAWKPWARLEFDAPVQFAVSPDNQTLAVMEQHRRPADGQLFDLQTAQPREKFKIDRDPKTGGTQDYKPQFFPDSKTLAIAGTRHFSLWDTAPPAPRVEMLDPDVHRIEDFTHKFDFTSDSRWLLTLNIFRTDRRLGRGAVVQVRDAQTGKVSHEVSFPEQLGLLNALSDLPDHRVLLRFESRKGRRHFLWHADDLLRYAAEHGSPPR